MSPPDEVPLFDPARDVDEEIRYHLDRRTEELVADGVDPAEARARAIAEFGDVEATAAYCAREDRAAARVGLGTHVRALTDDLRGVVRQLVRRPGAVGVPILVLAAGIALNALVFSVVRSVLLKPLPFRDAERTVVLHEVGDDGEAQQVAYPVLRAWAAGSSSLERLAGWLQGEVALVPDGPPVHVASALVTEGFFGLIDDPFLVGRGFDAVHHDENGPPAVVLAESLWRRAYAADPDLVGRSIELSGEAHAVVGVVRDAGRMPDAAEVWLPLERAAPQLVPVAGAKIITAVAVLTPSASRAGLLEELRGVAATVPGGAPDVRAVPVTDQLLGDVARPLWLLQGAVLLVLLAACANAAGLLLTRAVRRRGEMAVRVSLGAGSGRVGRALVLEGVAIGALAGLLGVAAAAGALRPALELVPADLPRQATVTLDPGVVLAALALALLTGAATSLAPALGAVRAAPADALRRLSARSGGGRGTRRLLEGLVVGQVAMATLLTAGAALLVRSFVATVGEDPGFVGDRVTAVDIGLPESRYPNPDTRLAFAHTLLERAAGLPGAEAVAIGRNLPVSGSSMTSPLEVEGRGMTDAVQVAAVSAGYFDVMGIPIVEGAGFGDSDREDGAPTLIVDRALTAGGVELGVGGRARSFFGGGLRDVVGVAGAVRHRSLRAAPSPVAYEPFFQRGGADGFTLLVRSSAPAGEVASAVRALMRGLDPSLPTDRVGTMEARLRASVAEPRFYTVGLTAFGLLAVLLSLAGCQAGLAHRVAAQRRELGLRMALGASAPGVRGQIVRRGVALTAIGALAGVALAVPGTRVLESQLYGVTATDPLTYAGVLALLLVAAVITADVPARRAARLDPATVLRD
jgi:predicted permease